MTAPLSQEVIAGIIDPSKVLQNQGHLDNLMGRMGKSTGLPVKNGGTLPFWQKDFNEISSKEVVCHYFSMGFHQCSLSKFKHPRSCPLNS